MKLVLIGIQGAGKSTQGNLLSDQLEIPYLSSGHILREMAKQKTRLGRYVKETINAGALMPDEKMIEIMDDYLSRPEYRKGYILDGFPRTVHQAERFSNNVDKVIYLDVPSKDALWRIAYRNDLNRSDETLPAIKKRIESFNKSTLPVVEYYEKKGILLSIDGMKTIKEINKEILGLLGKKLIKNKIHAIEHKDKKIIAVVGLPGSGKSEATEFFKEKKLPEIHFGKVLNDYVDEHHLTHDEKTHKALRENWRKEHGPAAFAVLNEKKIEKALETNNIIVINGMRSWEEYMYLKKKFKKTEMYIVAIYADKEVRYKRVSKRGYRSKLGGEERDINELIGTNMGATIAYSDFLVKNNLLLEDLHDNLEEVYRTIYFS